MFRDLDDHGLSSGFQRGANWKDDKDAFGSLGAGRDDGEAGQWKTKWTQKHLSGFRQFWLPFFSPLWQDELEAAKC